MHHAENISPLVESERERAKESRTEPRRTGACGWMRTCVCVHGKVTYEIKSFAAVTANKERIGPRARTRHYAVDLCDESLVPFSISTRDYRVSLKTRTRRSPNSNNVIITSVYMCARVYDTREKKENNILLELRFSIIATTFSEKQT